MEQLTKEQNIPEAKLRERIEELLQEINGYMTFEWQIKYESQSEYEVILTFVGYKGPVVKYVFAVFVPDDESMGLVVSIGDNEEIIKYSSELMEWLYYQTIMKYESQAENMIDNYKKKLKEIGFTEQGKLMNYMFSAADQIDIPLPQLPDTDNEIKTPLPPLADSPQGENLSRAEIIEAYNAPDVPTKYGECPRQNTTPDSNS